MESTSFCNLKSQNCELVCLNEKRHNHFIVFIYFVHLFHFSHLFHSFSVQFTLFSAVFHSAKSCFKHSFLHRILHHVCFFSKVCKSAPFYMHLSIYKAHFCNSGQSFPAFWFFILQSVDRYVSEAPISVPDSLIPCGLLFFPYEFIHGHPLCHLYTRKINLYTIII